MSKMAKVTAQKTRGVKRAAKAQQRAKDKKTTTTVKKAPPLLAKPTPGEKKPRKRHFAAPPLPDLSAKIVEPVLPPTTTAHEREARGLMGLDHESLQAALPAATLMDGERAMLEARAFCQGLLKKDDDALHLLGSMIAVRQTYVVFYRELQELLQREAAAAGRDVPALAEDYFILAAMHQAAGAFDEHDLMQGYVDTVLPHIADIVDRHSRQDEEAATTAAKKEAEARAVRPVPLGFLLDLESTTDTLPRDRSLVLVGWENAVLFVLDQITAHLLSRRETEPVQIVRFRDQAPRDHDVVDMLIELAPNQWKGCCNSEKDLAVCMGAHVLDRQVRLVDLLIFDNLSKAYSKGFFGRPSGADAGDTHKLARRWATKGGAGLIGAVPLPDRDDPDRLAPEYEQLRTFTMLRDVRVIAEAQDLDPAKYRVVVGSGLHRWDVPRDTLDGYSRSAVIKPGD